ncbi:MAG: pilus assembly protein [Acidobacteriota bacterium]|nr:pilus assembly protein [Acidobacteriota bacterium]
MHTPNQSMRRHVGQRAALAVPAGERGQSLVELAVVMPFLLLLFLGIVEFGYLFYVGIEVSNAAQAGVMYGAQTHASASDTPGMQAAALAEGVNVASLSAAASHFCSCSGGSGTSTCTYGDCPGYRILEFVQVNTQATVAPPVTLPGLPSTFTLYGKSVMRVEQ